jgi:hypothetical protein
MTCVALKRLAGDNVHTGDIACALLGSKGMALVSESSLQNFKRVLASHVGRPVWGDEVAEILLRREEEPEIAALTARFGRFFLLDGQGGVSLVNGAMNCV